MRIRTRQEAMKFPFPTRPIPALVTGALAALALPGVATPAAPPPVSYQKQVRPILQKRCQGCHQPANKSGKLDVTSFVALKSGGDHGPAVSPGNPDASPLVTYVSGKEPAMPKGGPPLSAGEVAVLRRWVAEGANDDTVITKDAIDAEHPPVYTAPPVIPALAFSPDGKLLAVAGYREILVHRADGSGLVGRLVGASDRIESLAFSPDGKLLAAVGGAPGRFGEAQFWGSESRKPISAHRIGYDCLYGASFSPDGTMLAFGAADHAARIITVPDGKPVLKFDNHSDWVFATAFDREGKHMITTGRDRAVKLVLIEGPSGSFVDDINKHYEGILCMARRPGEEQVAVGGLDATPRLYRVFREKARTMNNEDHNLIREFERQPGVVTALAFNPDGSRLAVAGVSGEARVYAVKDGRRLFTLKGHEGALFALAYAPDGQTLATAGFDGRVRLFNAATGALVKAFVPVPISPGAQKVATGSSN
jgi:WD40 repeat protein